MARCEGKGWGERGTNGGLELVVDEVQNEMSSER